MVFHPAGRIADGVKCLFGGVEYITGGVGYIAGAVEYSLLRDWIRPTLFLAYKLRNERFCFDNVSCAV